MTTTEIMQAFLLFLQTVVLIVCVRKAAAARRDALAAREAVEEMKDMGAPPPDVLPFPGVNPTGCAPWPGEREMATRAGIRLADLDDDQQTAENVAVYHHGAD